jgi:hypothetical protein
LRQALNEKSLATLKACELEEAKAAVSEFESAQAILLTQQEVRELSYSKGFNKGAEAFAKFFEQQKAQEGLTVPYLCEGTRTLAGSAALTLLSNSWNNSREIVDAVINPVNRGQLSKSGFVAITNFLPDAKETLWGPIGTNTKSDKHSEAFDFATNVILDLPSTCATDLCYYIKARTVVKGLMKILSIKLSDTHSCADTK